MVKYPLDPTPYPTDPRSKPIGATLADGGYAYVRDVAGIVHVVPDGPHVHPKILGGGSPASYAGDMTVRDERVADVTNLSGTFQFDDELGLRDVAAELRRVGLTVDIGAVRFFPLDGSKPVVLE
jgi:hypothetical protein